MIFKQIELGIMYNFVYLICDEETRECAVVDPAGDADSIITEAKGFVIKKVILTHTHPDHMSALPELGKRLDLDIYVHWREKNVALHKHGSVHRLIDGSKIKIGNIKIKVIHTPGHTAGGICLHFKDKLLTGDTLFVENVGTTVYKGGNMKKLKKSLDKLKEFPEKTEVWPGHDYGPLKHSTIKYEKLNNPYLK
ncbi:MBL fold metallo-hydrolase [Thermoproteota archaeon]